MYHSQVSEILNELIECGASFEDDAISALDKRQLLEDTHSRLPQGWIDMIAPAVAQYQQDLMGEATNLSSYIMAMAMVNVAEPLEPAEMVVNDLRQGIIFIQRLRWALDGMIYLYSDPKVAVLSHNLREFIKAAEAEVFQCLQRSQLFIRE